MPAEPSVGIIWRVGDRLLVERTPLAGTSAQGFTLLCPYDTESLDPAVLAWFWPFAREEPHGHPPFYALLGVSHATALVVELPPS